MKWKYKPCWYFFALQWFTILEINKNHLHSLSSEILIKYEVGSSMSFFFLRFYLFIRAHAQGGGTEREADSTEQGSLMRGSIPGPWDHVLSWRQKLNWLSHPGTPSMNIFKEKLSRWFWYIAETKNHTMSYQLLDLFIGAKKKICSLGVKTQGLQLVIIDNQHTVLWCYYIK